MLANSPRCFRGQQATQLINDRHPEPDAQLRPKNFGHLQQRRPASLEVFHRWPVHAGTHRSLHQIEVAHGKPQRLSPLEAAGGLGQERTLGIAEEPRFGELRPGRVQSVVIDQLSGSILACEPAVLVETLPDQ